MLPVFGNGREVCASLIQPQADIFQRGAKARVRPIDKDRFVLRGGSTHEDVARMNVTVDEGGREWAKVKKTVA